MKTEKLAMASPEESEAFDDTDARLAKAYPGDFNLLSKTRLEDLHNERWDLLWTKYYRAAHCYLVYFIRRQSQHRGPLADPHALADDLMGQLGMKIAAGKIPHQDSQELTEALEFRKYLRSVLSHLVLDVMRGQQRRETPLLLDEQQIAAQDAPTAADTEWRNELVQEAWQRLRVQSSGESSSLYECMRTAARLLKDDGAIPGHQRFADELSKTLPTGATVSPPTAGRQLSRARAAFSRILVGLSRESLGVDSDEEAIAELRRIGLADLLYLDDNDR